MFFSKNVLTIEKNQRILPKLLVFPLKKKSGKGGQSGKNPTIGGDLYDQGGSKNRGFHNGRNFGGHILTEHPVIYDGISGLDTVTYTGLFFYIFQSGRNVLKRKISE